MLTATSVKVLRTLPELEGIRPEWESWPGNRDSEMDTYLMCLRSNPGDGSAARCGGRT